MKLKVKKIKLGKLKGFFNKLPRILAVYAFLVFVAMLLASLIIGALVFYQYSVLAEDRDSVEEEKVPEFNDEIFQQIVSKWQEREEKFLNVNLEEFSNPFEMPIMSEEGLTED